jgi:hypothetical protein
VEFDETFPEEFDRPEARRPGMLVLLAGVGTSAATLGLLYAVNALFPEFHLMGWYANFVIPLGAMLVGLVAGSGYGVASWMTGAKISKGLLFQIVLLQIAVYFFSQYVEFLLIKRQLGNPPIAFLDYFDAITRAFAFNNNGRPGVPFGAWGYGMRALEIAGFSLCGLVAPAILFSVPYCESCQVYMRTADLGLLPAGIPPRKISKKDSEAQQAYEEEQRAALESGQKLLEQLLDGIRENDPRRCGELLREQADRKKEIGRQTARFAVSLQHCRHCQAGRVAVKLLVGQGEEQSVTELGQTEVDADFAQSLLQFRNA